MSQSASMHEKQTPTAEQGGMFAPLRHRWFAVLWTAALFSNMGSWMNEVGVAWQMTLLTDSYFLISLVQAATTAPVFLLALFAGALTDLLNRRKYLLTVQLVMLGVAALLATLTFLDMVGPWSMILLTFLLGIGAALTMPGWQAIVPELVPRPLVGKAVALNSVNINVARAIGPATAGIIIAQAGAGWVFVANAISFAFIAICLWVWPYAAKAQSGRSEAVFSAMISGLRYVLYTPDFRQILWRIGLFAFPAGAFWGLLPVIGRDVLNVDAGGYGMLIGAIGFGAVLAATVYSRIQKLCGKNGTAILATLIFAGAMVLIGNVGLFAIAVLCAFLAGAAWLLLLTTYNTAAQLLVPNWIRGRAMAVYLVFFFGGLAIGSMVWGVVAGYAGLSLTVMIAAALQILGMLAIAMRKLPQPAEGEGERSTVWFEHQHDVSMTDQGGAVLVQRLYHVIPEKRSRFIALEHKLGDARRREGAMRWMLFQSEGNDNEFCEVFQHPNWDAHLRSHERYTAADDALSKEIDDCLVADTTVTVHHYLEVQKPSNGDAALSDDAKEDKLL